MSSFNALLKEVHTRANRFFKSKPSSLNKSVSKLHEDAISILKTHTLCILDTETTGLDSDDRIWQISIRIIQQNKQVDELYETCYPSKNFEKLNDLIAKRVEKLGRIPISKINRFLQKYDNAVIIAHNISFDVPHCESEGIIFPENDYFFDTMWIIGYTRLVSLSKLCVFNRVDCESSLQHDASYDTRILRDCVITWLQKYIPPIYFSNGKWLWCIVEYLQNPSKYTNPSDRSNYTNKLSYNDCIETLKQLGYTIRVNKDIIHDTDSYYCVVYNKSNCYIEYNYKGIDIPKYDNVLPSISDEQKAIVDAIDTQNVTVDAVAGSGKTTTAMFIAHQYPQKRILMLTYNKHLQLDSKKKCANFSNIDIYTFHGYCGYIYEKTCNNDNLMYKYIAGKPLKTIDYNIIIVDEAQDLVDIYYKFVCIVDKYNIKKHTLMIIGDKYQNIYRFKGASSEYLEFPEKYFNKPFIHLSLHMSYRLTNQMSLWLNKDVMQKDRIKTCKDGKPVTIFFDNTQHLNDAIKYTSNKVVELLNNGVKTDQIMILCWSTKSTYCTKCINQLKQLTHIDVYVPTSDDRSINRECCKNKIVFSSIHQSKGLERDYVFIFQFDTSYCYSFYEYLYELNNLFYVALTRARQELFCVITYATQYFSDICRYIEPFSFIHIHEEDTPYVHYINNNTEIVHLLTEDMINYNTRSESVTKLCTYLKSTDEQKLNKLIEVEKLETRHILSNTPSVINSEEVSDISGMAITALIGLEYKDKNVIDNIHAIQKSIINSAYTIKRKKFATKYQSCDVDNILNNITNISQMLRLKSFDDYFTFNRIHRPLQLGDSKFNWISDDEYIQYKKVTRANLEKHHLSLDGTYEQAYVQKIESISSNKSVWRNEVILDHAYNISIIKGVCDLITNNTVIEFKFVESLNISYMCQTLLYTFMRGQSSGYLYNIRSGELMKISCKDEKAFMEILLNRYQIN